MLLEHGRYRARNLLATTNGHGNIPEHQIQPLSVSHGIVTELHRPLDSHTHWMGKSTDFQDTLSLRLQGGMNQCANTSMSHRAVKLQSGNFTCRGHPAGKEESAAGTLCSASRPSSVYSAILSTPFILLSTARRQRKEEYKEEGGGNIRESVHKLPMG